MKIRQLDSRIEIQQKVTAKSATSGRPVGAWLTIATVWASVLDQRPGRDESLASRAVEVSKLRAEIQIRWNPNLTADCRIHIKKPRERTLQVISPPAEIGGRRAFMEFMAEEVSTVG